jgi:hypothetical protein
MCLILIISNVSSTINHSKDFNETKTKLLKKSLLKHIFEKTVEIKTSRELFPDYVIMILFNIQNFNVKM